MIGHDNDLERGPALELLLEDSVAPSEPHY
jgi:hypothetical protein